jgi:uncharacterized protein YutE (UPF0331/DUF86 family)
MYFVNEEQIGSRLEFLMQLAETARALSDRWRDGDPVLALAQERALHLAIEGVTDIGSLLIDAFILRDASSYEDIVEILRSEGAFDSDTSALLLELVKLRRKLVQDYVQWKAAGLHELTVRLPELLPRFADQVRAFMAKELNGGG